MRTALTILTAALLGGCQASGGPSSGGPAVDSGGHPVLLSAIRNQPVWNGSETVFHTRAVRSHLQSTAELARPELARNDQRLALTTPQPLTAAGDWPQAEQPDLVYPRYIWLPTNANSQIFFVRRSETYGRRYNW